MMKKRLIAFLLILTMVWSSVGDLFPRNAFRAQAEESAEEAELSEVPVSAENDQEVTAPVSNEEQKQEAETPGVSSSSAIPDETAVHEASEPTAANDRAADNRQDGTPGDGNDNRQDNEQIAEQSNPADGYGEKQKNEVNEPAAETKPEPSEGSESGKNGTENEAGVNRTGSENPAQFSGDEKPGNAQAGDGNSAQSSGDEKPGDAQAVDENSAQHNGEGKPGNAQAGDGNSAQSSGDEKPGDAQAGVENSAPYDREEKNGDNPVVNEGTESDNQQEQPAEAQEEAGGQEPNVPDEKQERSEQDEDGDSDQDALTDRQADEEEKGEEESTEEEAPGTENSREDNEDTDPNKTGEENNSEETDTEGAGTDSEDPDSEGSDSAGSDSAESDDQAGVALQAINTDENDTVALRAANINMVANAAVPINSGNDEEPVLTTAAPTTMALAAANGSQKDKDDEKKRSELQKQIDQALTTTAGKLSGRIQIILEQNTIYEGNADGKIEINAKAGEVADDFELELSADDAGLDGISGSGFTTINANLVIKGIRVIMNSVIMGNEKSISVKNADGNSDDTSRGGSLVYNGTKNAMNTLSVEVGKNSTAEIKTTDTDDYITVKTDPGAKAVTVSTGDGLSGITAEIGGGDVTIIGGGGSDTVNLTLTDTGKIGDVYVDTDDNRDYLNIVNSGKTKSTIIRTGNGDDDIQLDLRPTAGDMSIYTGQGADDTNIFKGDHYSVENLFYSATQTPYEDFKNVADKTKINIINGDVEKTSKTTTNEETNETTEETVYQTVDTDDAKDRATIDVAVAGSVSTLNFEGGKGSSIHLWGELDGSDPDHNLSFIDPSAPGKGIKVKTKPPQSTGVTYSMNITTQDTAAEGKTAPSYNFTDGLTGKKTVIIDKKNGTVTTENGQKIFTYTAEDGGTPFTDYVFRTKINGYDRIVMNVGSAGKPLTLSNVVLDPDNTGDDITLWGDDENDGILKVHDLEAKGLNVLLRGIKINLEGKVEAQNVRAESIQGIKTVVQIMENIYHTSVDSDGDTSWSPHLGDALTDLVNIADKAEVNVNKNADIQAENDITLVARVKQYGKIIFFIPDVLNFLNLKIADAHINIKKGAMLNAKNGDLTATAKIDTVTGESITTDDQGNTIKETPETGPQFNVTLIVNDAGVNVEEGAMLTAGQDVRLSSESNIKVYNYSNPGLIEVLPFSIGVSMIFNSVTTEVNGSVDAGRKAQINATGTIKDVTKSSLAAATSHPSGGFFAFNIVDQNVLATIGGKARVTAKTNDVAIYSTATADIKTITSSETPPYAGPASDMVTSIKKLVLIYVNPVVISLCNGIQSLEDWFSNASTADKVERSLKKVEGGNYSVKVIEQSRENAEKGSATVKVMLEQNPVYQQEDPNEGDGQNQGENQNQQNNQNQTRYALVGVVTPTPKEGFRVKDVYVRYLEPGKDRYTYQKVETQDYKTWSFPVTHDNMEVLVTYEEGQQQQAAEAGNNEEDREDVFDLGELIGEAGEAAGGNNIDEDLGDEANGPAHPLIFDSTKMSHGRVVSWLTRDGENGEKLSISTVKGGQKVRLVPNPDASYHVEELYVEYTYKAQKNGKEVSQTDRVPLTQDEKDRYIFTVPEDLAAGVELHVMAVFSANPTIFPPDHDQKTGSVSVDVVVNNGEAKIEKGAEVTAGGQIDIRGIKRTDSENLADGSAIDTSAVEKAEKEAAKPMQVQVTKYNIPGADYAIKAATTVGSLTATRDRSAGATNNHPKFTIASDSDIDWSKVRVTITYYTKADFKVFTGTRTRTTKTIDKDSDNWKYDEASGKWVFTYQPSMLNNMIRVGTTADVSFEFLDSDGNVIIEDNAQSDSTTNLMSNPVNVSYNALKKKTGDKQYEDISVGTVTYVGTVGSKIYINYFPEKGYKLDPEGSVEGTLHKSNKNVLYASWYDNNVLQKAELKRDASADSDHASYWYFDLKDSNLIIPFGAIVTINAVFSEDQRGLQDTTAGKPDDQKNGTVSFEKSKVKVGDEVKITLKGKEGWFGASATVTYTTKNGTTKTLDAALTYANNGVVTFPMPDDVSETASLQVTPVFRQKTMKLNSVCSNYYEVHFAEGENRDNSIKLSDSTGYAGQTIKVTPSDKMIAAGYQVTGFSVTINGVTSEYSNTDQFTIPNDTADNATVKIEAKLQQKPVEISSLEVADQGKAVPVSKYVKSGENVIVNIEPTDNAYRIKYGTLRAVVEGPNGTQQIVLTRIGPNQYSFKVPAGSDENTRISLKGVFEPGTDGVDSSLGVGVAVSFVKDKNIAEIEGGTVQAGKGISLLAASIGNKNNVTAKGGFSQGESGIAGALGIQITLSDTKTAIRKDENGSISVKDGSIFMLSNNKQQFNTTGDASGKQDSEGEQTGVGAGIVFGIENLDTVSIIEDGVKLVNYQGTDEDAANDLTPHLTGISVTAQQKLKEKMTAVAGAKGGSSFVPVAAVDIYVNDVKAEVGKLDLSAITDKLRKKAESDLTEEEKQYLDGYLPVGGKVTLKASSASDKEQYNHLITANASAAGEKAAIGGAFIVTWISSDVKAILHQSLNATGDISITSKSGDAVRAVATSSAAGGFKTEKTKAEEAKKKGSSDRQANNMLGGAANIAGRYGNVDGGEIMNEAADRQNAENSEKTASVSASFVLNIQKNKSKAEIKDGVNIITAGELTVKSSNRTEGFIRANSSATQSDTGAGLGVALNIVKMDNIARIGTGAVTAAGVKVIADVAEEPTKVRKIDAAQNESEFSAKLAAKIKQAIMSVIGEDLYDKFDWALDADTELFTQMATVIIERLNLTELMTIAMSTSGGITDMLKGTGELLKDRLEGCFYALIDPVVTIVDEFIATVKDWNGDFVKDDLKGMLLNLVGDTYQVFLGVVKASTDSLMSSSIDMVTDKVQGKGWDGTKLEQSLKASIADEFKKQWTEMLINNTLKYLNDTFPFLTDNNKVMVEKMVKAIREKTNTQILKEVVPYVEKVFRENVYDYEPVLVQIQQNGFVKFLKDTLIEMLNKSSMAFTNAMIDKLVGKMDVNFEREAIADRHVITTQAISGAGAKETSAAGSMAIAVVNLTTKAEIAGSSEKVTVTNDGDLFVNAEEVRRIRTHATAAVDGDEPDNNLGAETSEDKNVKGSSASQQALSDRQEFVNVTANNGVNISFPQNGDVYEELYISPKDGYKWGPNSTITRTYTKDDTEIVDKLQPVKEGDRYLIKPVDGLEFEYLEDDERKALGVAIDIQFEEDLKTIPNPGISGPDTAEFNKRVTDRDIAASVSVQDREQSGTAVQGIAGDLAEIKVQRQAGYTVDQITVTDNEGKVCASYRPAQQQRQGQEIARGAVNQTEEYYVFNLPAAGVKSIIINFKEDPEDRRQQAAADQDAAGRSIGVGESFALTYGNSDVTARIGSRDKTDIARGDVTAGTVSVTASSKHEEENYSTAGTDPFEGVNQDDQDAEKEIGIDASLAINILDNDIYAGITEGTKVTTKLTKKTPGEERPSDKPVQEPNEDEPENITVTNGAVIVSSTETGANETKASAFSTGSSSAVGMSVALNIALSDIEARLGSGATAADKVVVRTHTLNQDETWAFASALGADIQRMFNKFANATETFEDTANSLTNGTFFSNLGKNQESKNEATKTNKKITDRLNNPRIRQGNGEENEAHENLPVGINAMRALDVQADNGDAGDEDADVQPIVKKETGQDAEGQGNTNDKKTIQVAATIGVTVANHSAKTYVGGTIDAKGDISLTSRNASNFRSRSTSASMSLEEGPGKTIALAVGIGVNRNKALVDVDGSLLSENGNITAGSNLTLNMTDYYRGIMTVQSISGAVSGKKTDWSVAGALSVMSNKAESHVNLNSARIEGKDVAVTAYDKSKIAVRAGGINASKGANVGMGISVAGIGSDNRVEARIADGATITADSFRLTAEKAQVDWDDYKFPLTWRDAISDSSGLDDEERENIYPGLIDIHRNPGEKSYHVTVNMDTYALMKVADALSFLSSTNYYAESIAGSLMGKSRESQDNKLNLAGSVSVVRANNIINAILGKNVSITPKDESATGDIVIKAIGDSNNRLLGGAVAGGNGINSAGITVTVLSDKDIVKTEIGSGAGYAISSNGSVSIGSEATTYVQTFNAAASVSTAEEGKKSLGGAINTILLKNASETSIGDDVTISAGEDLNITAQADMDLIQVSVSAAMSKKGTAGGGTVAYTHDRAKADVTIGDGHLLTAGRNVSIFSKASDDIISVIASASAARGDDSKAVAGAINVIRSATRGNVTMGTGTKVDDVNQGVTAREGSVSIKGDTDTRAINVTASVAGGRGTAIGLSVNINLFERESKVDIGGGEGYLIKAAKDLQISAYGDNLTAMGALAVAGATGAKGGGYSGNFAVISSRNVIGVQLGAGEFKAAGEAAFSSGLKDVAAGVAGGFGVSKSGNSIGGTIMYVNRNNTVKTDMGTAVVRAEGNAGTLYKKISGKQESFKGLYVGANVHENLVVGALGVAVSGAKGAEGNFLILLNENEVTADASAATLRAIAEDGLKGGSAKVLAKNHSRQTVLSGGFNLGSTLAVGAGIVALTSQKNIKATAHNIHAYNDVDVLADNDDKNFVLNISAGGSKKTAVEIGFDVQYMRSKVNAAVASDIDAKTGSFTLKANNNATINDIDIAAAGSQKYAVTPTVALAFYTGETNALLGVGTVKAAKGINIIADSDKYIDQYTIGVAAAGKVAVSGAVSSVSLKDRTNAIVQKDVEITGETMDVTARSNYELIGAGAAIAASTGDDSLATFAVNILLTIAKANVLAEMGGKADLSGSARVEAQADRDIINTAIDVSGNSGTGAAGVTVMVTIAGTKMDQDAANMMTYGAAEERDSKTFDTNELVMKMDELGLDTSDMRAQERTDSTGASYTTSGFSKDIEGNGHSNGKVKTKNAGTFDVSSSHIDQASYKDDQSGKGDKAKGEDTEDIKMAKGLGNTVYKETEQDFVAARIASDAEVNARGISVTARQNTEADLFGATVAVSAGSKSIGGAGVSLAVAMLRSNVIAAALGTMDAKEGDVNISALSTSGKKVASQEENERNEALANDFDKVTASKGRSIRAVGIAVGVGKQAGVAAAGAAIRTDNITDATLSGTVKNAAKLNVNATIAYEDILAVSVAAGGGMKAGVALSAAVAVANSSLSAKIDKNARIEGSNTQINLTTNSDFTAITGAATAALAVTPPKPDKEGMGTGVAGTAGVSIASNTINQKTSVEKGAVIDMTGDQGSLKAAGNSNTAAESYLLGITASTSLAGGIGVAITNIKPTVETTIGAEGKEDGIVSLGKLDSIEVLNDVTGSGYSALGSFVVGKDAGISANVLLQFNDTKAKATVANAEADEIGSMTINGDLKAGSEAILAAVAGGKVGVGLSMTYADVNSSNIAELLTDNFSAKIKGNLKVSTNDFNADSRDNETSVKTSGLALTVGYWTAVGLNASVALNRAVNEATIKGSKGITADQVELHAYGKANAKSFLFGGQIAYVTVGASVAYSKNSGSSIASMKLDDAANVSGIDAKSSMDGVTDTELWTGAGSIFGVQVNVAKADGKTKSIVDIMLNNATDKRMNISAVSHGGNNVEATVDNLIGLTGYSVAPMVGIALSEDEYTSSVKLAGGEYSIAGINVNTDYTTQTNAVVTPSASGVAMSAIRIAYNMAWAENTTYAGSELVVSNGSIDATGNIDVKTIGETKVDSGIQSTNYISEEAIGLVGSYSLADLSTRQAAVIQLDKAKILNAGDISVKSITNRAEAGAAGGASGVDNPGRPGLDIKLGSVKVNFVEANENLASSALVLGSGSGDSTIKAASLAVNAGMGTKAVVNPKTGKTETVMIQSKAESVTKNGYEISIISAGGLDSKAFTTDSYNSGITGVNAEITGNIEATAASNTYARAEGTAPGEIKLVEVVSISNMKAGNGKKGDKQTTKVLIGDDTVLTSKKGSVKLSADSNGYAETDFVKKTHFSIAGVKTSSVPTESWYETGVQIGKNAMIESEGSGNVNISTSSGSGAKSTIDAFSLGLALDYTKMKGQNTISDKSYIDIGDSTEIHTDTGNINISGSNSTKARASIDLSGGGVFDGKTAKAENHIDRIMQIMIDDNAKLNARQGKINISSRSGIGDNITADAFTKSGGLVSIGQAEAINEVASEASIIIYQNTDIQAGKNINMLATATSNLLEGDTNSMRKAKEDDDDDRDLECDEASEEEIEQQRKEKDKLEAKRNQIEEDSIKAQEESGLYPSGNKTSKEIQDYVKRDKDYGVYSKAVAKTYGAGVSPTAKAINDLQYAAMVLINKDDDLDADWSGITSNNGSIKVEVNSAGLRAKSSAEAGGGAAGGWADAWSETEIQMQNTIWVDKSDIYSAKGTTFLAQSGTGYEQPYINVYAKAKMKAAVGDADAYAIISGSPFNQIRSKGIYNVDIKGEFNHIDIDPRDQILFTVNAPQSTLYHSGQGDKTTALGGAKHRCDFCEYGQSGGVRLVSGGSKRILDDTLEKAFEKALVPLVDIEKQSSGHWVSKARYGDEESKVAAKIFALDLVIRLTKDIQLDEQALNHYKLWNNKRTGQDVILMPNCTRIYTDASGRLEYVSEVLRGDVLGNGETHLIDIYTALTKYAFSIEPVIPIGSTGQLDFRDGTLTLPSGADYELYLDEISSKWMKESLETGFIRWLDGNQDEVNSAVAEGKELPDGIVLEDLTEGAEKDGWKLWWLGRTPETAESEDETLIFLLMNGETDEIDAFRTSTKMMNSGEDPVDVSLYLFRDSESDRMEVEKYNCLFFDTAEGERSLVKAMTVSPTNRELEMPVEMEIVLRAYDVQGADLKAYRVSGIFFAMNDGTDGKVSMFNGEYEATCNDNVFESDFVRIEGINGNNVLITIKEGQDVWAELTGENTATDPDGNRFVRVNTKWYPEGQEPSSSRNAEDDAA